MKTRFFALVLVLMLVWCGSLTAESVTAVNTETEALPLPALPLTQEPITLRVMFKRDTRHGDFTQMWYLKRLAEMTGVTLQIDAVESAGWNERMSLAFATNDLPDIFLTGLTYNDAATYGAAGFLLPLEDLLKEHSPNAQRIFGFLPATVNNVTSSDGHIYMMPAYNTTARDMVQLTSFINEAWIKKAGLEMPHTLEELYACLVAIRDGDGNGNGEADEIPLSFVYNGKDGEAASAILTAFGYVNPRHDVLEGKYVYVPAAENFREYLKFMSKLWKENLLDHELFTQSAEEYSAKIAAYRVGMISNEPRHHMTLAEQKHAYNLTGPLTSAFNSVLMWPAKNNEMTGGTFAITKNCQYPEIAVKLLDFFYSEEGSFMCKCGPEEGQWEGVGGWTRLSQPGNDGSNYKIAYDTEKFTSFYAFRMDQGLMNMPFFYTDVHADLVLGADADATLNTRQVYTSGAYDARRDGYPAAATFTEDEQDALAAYVLMDNYVDQMAAKFITGDLNVADDEVWQSYLDTLDSYDLDALVEIYQAAYDRWNQQN